MLHKAFKLYNRKYGTRAQIIKACEELAELQVELCKYLNDEPVEGNITEEMADVSIMLDQLKMIFGNSLAVEVVRKHKINRMLERIK